MAYINEIAVSIFCFIIFVVYGYYRKTKIKEYLSHKDSGYTLIYAICIYAIFIALMYFLGYFLDEIGFMIPIFSYIFSRIILYYAHVNWHSKNKNSYQILSEVFTPEKRHDILAQAWFKSYYSYFNNEYIIDVEPFNFKHLRWDDVYEITGFEADAYTTTTTSLCFWYGNDDKFIINDFHEKFSEFTKFMEKKFPMISKEWPNHVFHAGGEPVTLYSYKSQVY